MINVIPIDNRNLYKYTILIDGCESGNDVEVMEFLTPEEKTKVLKDYAKQSDMYSTNGLRLVLMHTAKTANWSYYDFKRHEYSIKKRAV